MNANDALVTLAWLTTIALVIREFGGFSRDIEAQEAAREQRGTATA